MTELLSTPRRAPAGVCAGATPPPAARRTPLVARLRRRPPGRPARLAVLAAAALALVPAGARAQPPAEGSMVEAVIAALAQPDRRIFVAPGLEPSPAMARAGIGGRPRHTAATLETLKRRFDATIAYPEEAIRCADGARAARCTIPGDGMVFYFHAPEQALRNGVLPIRVTLYHNGRGAGGQILRETWDLLVRREANAGWTVVQKTLSARGNGPA